MPTTKAHTIEYKGEKWNVPAGLRLKQIDRGSTKGEYWLDEPEKVFPPNSMQLHDAIFRGVIIKPEHINFE